MAVFILLYYKETMKARKLFHRTGVRLGLCQAYEMYILRKKT
jgi:hypothetical protein